MDLHRLKQKEVAELLGLTSRQIHNLVEQGLPRHADKGKAFFDGPDCVAWYLKTKVDAAVAEASPPTEWDAKARLDTAKAELAELELARERRQMLPTAWAVSQLERVGALLRSKLQTLSARWAPRFLGAKTIPDMANRVDQAVNEALQVLAELGAELEREEQVAGARDDEAA